MESDQRRSFLSTEHCIQLRAGMYNTRAEIIPGVALNSMLELSWQSVAERILVWLKEREL